MSREIDQAPKFPILLPYHSHYFESLENMVFNGMGFWGHSWRRNPEKTISMETWSNLNGYLCPIHLEPMLHIQTSKDVWRWLKTGSLCWKNLTQQNLGCEVCLKRIVLKVDVEVRYDPWFCFSPGDSSRVRTCFLVSSTVNRRCDHPIRWRGLKKYFLQIQGCRFGPWIKAKPWFHQYLDPAWCHLWLCFRKCIGDKSAIEILRQKKNRNTNQIPSISVVIHRSNRGFNNSSVSIHHFFGQKSTVFGFWAPRQVGKFRHVQPFHRDERYMCTYMDGW